MEKKKMSKLTFMEYASNVYDEVVKTGVEPKSAVLVVYDANLTAGVAMLGDINLRIVAVYLRAIKDFYQKNFPPEVNGKGECMCPICTLRRTLEEIYKNAGKDRPAADPFAGLDLDAYHKNQN